MVHNSDLPEKAEDQATYLEDTPDGGLRAWLVVLGAFLDLLSTFGIANSYGVFQHHYQTTLLKTSPASIISLIGSLQLFLLYGLSPLIGRIFDAYGTRVLLPMGTFVTVFSIMMLSLCQEGKSYQFFLSQGLCFGIGNALVFTPALAIVGHWFKRKRAYALGIVASGSAVGGLFYPIMIQRLLPTLGFAWTVRVAGFITLACLSVSCVTMKTRLPLRGQVSLKDVIDFGGYKDWRYALITMGSFLNFYALFIPYFYIEQYADFEGVSPGLSQYLVALINGVGIPARVIPGMLADRFGPLNVLIPSLAVSGLLTLGLWLPSRGPIPITLFACLYGLFSGGFTSLLPAYVAKITPVEKYGARLGSIYMVVAVADLAGAPSAGTFVRVVNQIHFNGLVLFTGLLVLVATLFFVAARFVHCKRLSAKI